MENEEDIKLGYFQDAQNARLLSSNVSLKNNCAFCVTVVLYPWSYVPGLPVDA